MVLVRCLCPACGALRLLFSGTAVMRSALARVKADGATIDLLRWLLPFGAFMGMGEVCELVQRFAQA